MARFTSRTAAMEYAKSLGQIDATTGSLSRMVVVVERLQLARAKVDEKLWAGAAAIGWRVIEAKPGSAATAASRAFKARSDSPRSWHAIP